MFNDFENDPELWVAIITGEGRGFSAGNDLKYQAVGGAKEFMKMLKETGKKPSTMGFAGLTERYNRTKPVIAAVNGVAMGGGFEIALACDLIIASENARFALPEPKVGLFAGAGGVLRLPRVIGMKRAMGMMLTARHVPAEEGLELGFVNEVVPGGNEECLAAAKKWAEMILECGPMVSAATAWAVTVATTLRRSTVAANSPSAPPSSRRCRAPTTRATSSRPSRTSATSRRSRSSTPQRISSRARGPSRRSGPRTGRDAERCGNGRRPVVQPSAHPADSCTITTTRASLFPSAEHLQSSPFCALTARHPSGSAPAREHSNVRPRRRNPPPCAERPRAHAPGSAAGSGSGCSPARRRPPPAPLHRSAANLM